MIKKIQFSFKKINKVIFLCFICIGISLTVSEPVFAANGDTYYVPTAQEQIMADHNGDYHSVSYITVSDYNLDGTVTVTLADEGYSTNGYYNYWTGDGLIFVDGVHTATLLTNGRKMSWYGTSGTYWSGYRDTVSVSFKLAQGKTYAIEQKNRVYGGVVESAASYKIYISVPAQTFTATMNHYKRNATNTTWIHFQTTSKTVTRGVSFTPTYVNAPIGYYASGYNTWTTGYGTNLGSGSITMPGSNTVTEVYYYPNNYYLDLNGYLNGTVQGNTSPMGTADVYINGILVANDVSDYYTAHPYGSTYEVKDIKTNEGYTYTGSSSYSGTITGNTSIAPSWNINQYTNTISHWAWGFQKKEGNNGDAKTAYNLGNTTFTKKYKESYTLTTSDAVVIPKGFQLRSQFCTGSLSSDGTWYTYDLGYAGTQLDKKLFFEYDYDPITYNLTYDTDGGTINESSYSTTYNVIYGVSFPTDVTKEGYIFMGWEVDNFDASGINETFYSAYSSVDDFYNKMASRTTGDKIVKAKWKKISKPTINVVDQYFFKNDTVSCEVLLKAISANDQIDGDLSKKIEITSMLYPDGSLINNPTDLDTSEIGKVLITYRCINSSDVACVENAYAIIVDVYGETILDTSKQKVFPRFISLKYINTLDINSIWRKNEYDQLLRLSLMKEEEHYLSEYEWINE